MSLDDPQLSVAPGGREVFGQCGPRQIERGKQPDAVRPRSDCIGQHTAQGEAGVAFAHDPKHQVMQRGEVLLDEGQRGGGRTLSCGDGRCSGLLAGLGHFAAQD